MSPPLSHWTWTSEQGGPVGPPMRPQLTVHLKEVPGRGGQTQQQGGRSPSAF